jgi:hypothetical protein
VTTSSVSLSQHRELLLRQTGWTIDHERVERIWQSEGLMVSHKQPQARRLWLTDRSCIRLRPSSPMNAWRSVSPASSRRSHLIDVQAARLNRIQATNTIDVRARIRRP